MNLFLHALSCDFSCILSHFYTTSFFCSSDSDALWLASSILNADTIKQKLQKLFPENFLYSFFCRYTYAPFQFFFCWSGVSFINDVIQQRFKLDPFRPPLYRNVNCAYDKYNGPHFHTTYFSLMNVLNLPSDALWILPSLFESPIIYLQAPARAKYYDRRL